jgi:hypothetical protein
MCGGFAIILVGLNSVKGLLTPEAPLDRQAVRRGRQSPSLETMYLSTAS